MMTKYLDRTCIDKCMKYLSQERADGRAKSGLEVQGGEKRQDQKADAGAVPAGDPKQVSDGSPPPRPPSGLMRK